MKWYKYFVFSSLINIITIDKIVLAGDMFIDAELGVDIHLTEDTILYNHSQINANIYTGDNNIEIHNFGTINGTVYANDAVLVQQIVHSDAELNKVNVSGADLFVDMQNVSADLNVIKALNAVDINIDKTHIYIDDFTDWQNWDKHVNLTNTTVLHINNPDTVNSDAVVKHVKELISVRLENVDDSYKVKLEPVGKNAFTLNVIRETNYTKEFVDDKRGELLEDLRNNKSDDSLLNMLDNATSTQEVESIMQLSYHFNPRVLINPVKMINNLSMMNLVYDINAVYSGFSGVYIIGNKTDAYGVNTHIDTDYKNAYLSLGFNFYKFQYHDSFNDFDGLMYDLTAGLKTSWDNVWVSGKLGLSFIDFDTDDILYHDDVSRNPKGYSKYAVLNVGYNYSLFQDLIIAPYVGVSEAEYKVLGVKDTDYDIRSGFDIQYSFVVDNIKYKYNGTGAISTNDDLFASFKVGFMSEIDNAGIDVRCDVLKTDKDVNYKLSINANIAF